MTTYRAVWKGQVLAQSDRTVKVEGNEYFPADSLRREFFTSSTTHTTCPWKGLASYYTVTVDGEVNRDAAWYYPEPSAAAENIRDSVAFWHGVKVQKVEADGGEPEQSRPVRASHLRVVGAHEGAAAGAAGSPVRAAEAYAVAGPLSWWRRTRSRLRLGSV